MGLPPREDVRAPIGVATKAHSPAVTDEILVSDQPDCIALPAVGVVNLQLVTCNPLLATFYLPAVGMANL